VYVDNHRVARLQAERVAGYRFTDPIIYAAGLRRETPERRRLHHRTLAAALERHPDESRADRLLEFAGHVIEGGLDEVSPCEAMDLRDADRRV
jgi:hypothetical protein